ncbi:MAG: carboxypeptidase regulatory-like domain-containing protein [Acidobacteria bacterium]|nr:carboxypeptidase regulatory-like domain-containing protein [Acidobacteriota bacterium]
MNTRTRSTWTSPGMVRPDANGHFSLSSFPEGEYAFIGRGTDSTTPGTRDMPLYAEARFIMAGDDLSGIIIQFEQGVSVGGQVVVAEGDPVPNGMQLRLMPVGSIPGSAAPPASQSVRDDGSFEFTGVAPGRYRLTAIGTTNLTLRSALIGDTDTLDDASEVIPRGDVTGMRVVLTSRPTQIAGTLFDGLGRPAPEYAVVVFSTDRAHWANAPRRMTGLVKLDSRGQYRITGLPAGTYYLAAVTDAEPAELSDPLFLEQLATAAEVSDSQ